MKLVQDGALRLDEPVMPRLQRWQFPASPYRNRVTVRSLDKGYQTGRKYAADFKHNMKILFDDSLPKWNYRAVPECL